MIPSALGGNMQLLVGQISIVALILGFVISLAEFILMRSRLPQTNATLIEVFGLGLMLISTGLVLPDFKILMTSGFAVLLVLWPATYCILFLTRKSERSLVRAIATFMFGSYLLLGFLYIYL
jgi:hypothetical protein